MKFQGYRRPDGRIGIRNHVLVIPTVACVNRVAMDISNRTGAATFMHPYGCTFDAEENRTTEEAFIGHGLHPNVGAVLVVSLGCETASGSKVFDAIKASGARSSGSSSRSPAARAQRPKRASRSLNA
ncbi:hypothetical protein GCM10023067_52700 [Aminobacter aganoensis]|uniref:UxaA family hydrolase n=1 Tax=Aminobacter aganoensis TaxID=83264 RepID=UPI0031E73F98